MGNELVVYNESDQLGGRRMFAIEKACVDVGDERRRSAGGRCSPQ